jgi:hypothetical protein
MGGLLAGIDHRLRAGVLIVGDGGWVTHETNPQLLTMPLEEFSEEYGAWIEAMWPIEPIHYVSHASPTPLLFQNAIRDQFVDVQDALRFQDAASDPKEVIWYESEHWPVPDQVFSDNAKWLQQYLGPGTQFLGPTANLKPLDPSSWPDYVRQNWPLHEQKIPTVTALLQELERSKVLQLGSYPHD